MTTAVCRLNALQADVINRDSNDFSSAARRWQLSALVVASQRRSSARSLAVDPALRVVEGLPQSSVKHQALRLLADLDEALVRYDVASLPTFSARSSDDGSATIEMRFPDRRLAFTIEPDRRESGWHVVTSRSAGGLQACGDLPESASDLELILALATRRFPKK